MGARWPLPRSSRPERSLLLGWNRRGAIIADELSRYVAAGSRLTIAADTPTIVEEVEAIALSSDNLSVALERIDTSSASAIAALDPTAFDHVLVLGYSDTMAPQSADTRTLVTLLHLRTASEQNGKPMKVVSEMIDVRNRALAEVTKVNDFVVSNKLVSLMLAQASENEYLEAIFKDLLDEEGSEICLKPARDYVPLGEPVTFYAVADAARARSEVAIGHHRLSAANGRPGMAGIIVNPSKSERISYGDGDRVIVLTRD